MVPFALTIFCGAFLLFQVQPLIAKYILPWFGGGPSVWTTCMLFFQVVLLAGYAYAHVSIAKLRPKTQARVHLALLVAALVYMPLGPSVGWKPDAGAEPITAILLLLAANLGLPYFVLSSSAPLMQGWFALENPGRSPYRLYALSNAASLAALLSYPFVVEPALTRTAQAGVWSLGFAVFAVCAGACAVRIWKLAPACEARASEPVSDPASPASRFLWLALPASASVLLLAFTNQLCQDVAVVPFLWVLPLSLYLLSFVICFDHERWYSRRVFAIGLIPATGIVLWLLFDDETSLTAQVAGYSVALFVYCMAAHGEVVRRKPHASELTRFYLMIATGGALGGVLVGVVAPLVFDMFLELHFGLLACAALVLVSLLTDPSCRLHGGTPRVQWTAIVAVYLTAGVALTGHVWVESDRALARKRSFYGVLTVFQVGHSHRFLRNGVIEHGLQYFDPRLARVPTTYFGTTTGVGLTMRSFPRTRNRNIGVVGLGVGTLAAYGRPGDHMRFYEINPDVETFARKWFTYLDDSAAHVDVVLGDARLTLEREEPQKFDILVLDAFTSDAIPIHLLTKEAFEIYKKHMRPDGVIAVNISNRHFDLMPVLERVAESEGLEAVRVANADKPPLIWYSEWALLTRNRRFLQSPLIRKAARRTGADNADLWSDDYANVLQALKF